MAKETEPVYFIKNTGGRLHCRRRCRKLERGVAPILTRKSQITYKIRTSPEPIRDLRLEDN